MASLKALRVRINSVKSTRKITQAMKMVAAAKLRRAQAQAEAGAPLCRADGAHARLARRRGGRPARTRRSCWSAPARDKVHLLVVVTADRGLAGAVQHQCRPLRAQPHPRAGGRGQDGQDPRRRPQGRDLPEARIRPPHRRRGQLRRQEAHRASRTPPAVADRITAMLDAGEFDVCTLVYNRFRSVIAQIPTEQRLIPAPLPEADGRRPRPARRRMYEYEPTEEEILATLLPRNLAIQIYRAAAGEQCRLLRQPDDTRWTTPRAMPAR